MFRCEKCNLEMDTFNWRLILSINVVDMTDNQWVQCFQEQGEDILGIKAQELGDLFISDKESYDKIFEVNQSMRRCKPLLLP
jgi:replication factor A1